MISVYTNGKDENESQMENALEMECFYLRGKVTWCYMKKAQQKLTHERYAKEGMELPRTNNRYGFITSSPLLKR